MIDANWLCNHRLIGLRMMSRTRMKLLRKRYVRSLGRTYGFRTIISFNNCLNRLELIMQPYFGGFPVSFFQLTTGTNEHKNRNELAHCT